VKVRPAIVIDPLRGGPLFPAMERPTVPDPFPEAPDVIEIHDTCPGTLVVQSQPVPALTATLLDPPSASMVSWPGWIENEHPSDWLTVNTRPAIVSVPARADPVLLATSTFTPPLPLPLAPDAIVSHDALLTAVHTHPLATLTDVATDPPLEPTFRCAGASE
jgi:hypothetical protein